MKHFIAFVLLLLLSAVAGVPSISQGTTPEPDPVYLPIVLRPAPTATATATSTPQPTQTPQANLFFNVAVVAKCERQPAGNWFEGTIYVNGVPSNGYFVAFSDAPDGPIRAKMESGPHAGYPGWKDGYYSHIISSSAPIAGGWSVWIVDEDNRRISVIATWQSTGPGVGCNQAVVDFDSRP